jgi:hypothetical protein
MSINADTYSDYKAVVYPPDGIAEVISKYRKASARLIGPLNDEFDGAILNLTEPMPRLRPALMNLKLDLHQKKFLKIPAVNIRIEGFGYFVDAHTHTTIYAKICQDEKLTEWLARVNRVFGFKRQVIPHIPVVTNVGQQNFAKLWPNFKDKPFYEKFTPTQITILARPMILQEQHQWAVFKEIYLRK